MKIVFRFIEEISDKPCRTTDKGFERKIAHRLRKMVYGATIIRFDRKHMPDIICFDNIYTYGIECKRYDTSKTWGAVFKKIARSPPNTPNTCLLYTSPSPRD